MKLKTVAGLNDYIEMLLELTIMPHELSPQGYTDPQEKHYRLGQRDSLIRVQKYISAGVTVRWCDRRVTHKRSKGDIEMSNTYLDDLKKQVDEIISHADDDERAHAEEDTLHLEVINKFCPDWVADEISRLSDADFQRWCA